MSGGSSVLALKEDDVRRMLTAKTHLGTNNLDFQMKEYCFKRRPDDTCLTSRRRCAQRKAHALYIAWREVVTLESRPIVLGGVQFAQAFILINLKKTWEKLLLAARAIVAIENPAEVCAISSRPYGQRAVLKFASFTGATPIAGRFTPGTFTNQIQAAFREPRLLVVCDPRADHQPVTEASYVNLPVIAFCNTGRDPPLRGHRHPLQQQEPALDRAAVIMVDLFFYRDPEETEKEEQAQAVVPERAVKETAEYSTEQWGGGDVTAAPAEVTDWSATAEVTSFAAAAPAPTAVGVAPVATDDWSTAAPAVEDWSATPAAPTTTTTEWGAGADSNWA
ncbi:hypothetical protein MRX96_040484 [Rhipicephalus microplus]